MLIIGIAGGSGSGKTTVVKAITQQLKENVVVIPQDSYYKDLGHLSEEEKRVHNFDHPESIDFDLLRAQLKELRDGKTVEQPIYSYLTCGRSKDQTMTVRPADIIIVEGIHALGCFQIQSNMLFACVVDIENGVLVFVETGAVTDTGDTPAVTAGGFDLNDLRAQVSQHSAGYGSSYKGCQFYDFNSG